MLVFAQERHVIEREPQWRDVRAQRKRVREAARRRARTRRARGTPGASPTAASPCHALLGMVNHTPQWLDPRGRLSPEQIADGYCDLILRAAA